MAAFARAAVLGRHDAGRELSEAVAANRPSLQAPVKRYRNAATEAEKKFAAALILLRSPGLSINVGPPLPFRDEVVLRRIDDFRQNWWCAIGPDEAPVPAAFLTADERRAFDAEWQALRAAGAGPAWMGARAVEWAKSHPSDPAAPEALHLTVRATRYGCADARNSEASRAAFALLHSRWPHSEWAAKTPYWF